MSNIARNYEIAKELYGEVGVDTDAVLKKLAQVPISVHCWQIDDLQGWEFPAAAMTGGIAATGDAPGKANTPEEFMVNLSKALDLIPGHTKLALHSIYMNKHGKNIRRNEITPAEFAEWVDYAKERGIGLDFNPTYFSHPEFDSSATLTSPDEGVRRFWIEHGIACRKIGDYFGRELGEKCITNHWIGDGSKDICVDKLRPRMILKDSLDQIFAEPLEHNIDSCESKVFGLGSEAYVPGSNEFYTEYAAHTGKCIVCMDAGHFHPTETIGPKFSSYLAFGDEIQLHVSRPVRWDSDHVVILDDATKEIMEEIAAYDAYDKVHIGTDYFDASINRIAATAIGARSARRALLLAMLRPMEELKKLEYEGNTTKRLALLEEVKMLPAGLVWDYFCESQNVPGREWIKDLKTR
ncbi:MAG: L-rhamnose isomerase [Oscillospiraceae bacterium]|nr:L-rhamnose isomerase [Oscillospiraceae bacterium]